ncbi:MAG: guanylate kinase [Gammaproteobacteria bacterium TMED34]|nr:MAG: guanylate kinase [Gammaproteobacteria bacterium TMED34]|tara:strand:- start:2740 stop:3375 length:636 start_codon:yes stop_codon:yes gene_type:complete
MAEKKAGIIVILSSPSGAGKTTLVRKISSRKKYKISISHTTRKPRSTEKNGRDYFFIKKKEFKKLIKDKKFLEYAKVFNNYYGSLKESVINKLKNGENVIFDIDWQGTRQIRNKKLKYKIITIFILPPSKKELFKRLLKREKKDEKIAKERMKQFKDDIMNWKDYDFTVINDNVEKCYKLIISFIDLQMNKKTSLSYNKKYIKNHIDYLIN